MNKESKVSANIISDITANSIDEYFDQIGHIYLNIQKLFNFAYNKIFLNTLNS